MASEEMRKRAREWMEGRYGNLKDSPHLRRLMPMHDIPGEIAEFTESEVKRVAREAAQIAGVYHRQAKLKIESEFGLEG